MKTLLRNTDRFLFLVPRLVLGVVFLFYLVLSLSPTVFDTISSLKSVDFALRWFSAFVQRLAP